MRSKTCAQGALLLADMLYVDLWPMRGQYSANCQGILGGKRETEKDDIYLAGGERPFETAAIGLNETPERSSIVVAPVSVESGVLHVGIQSPCGGAWKVACVTMSLEGCMHEDGLGRLHA